jgi:hypothetical protein
MKDIYFTQTIWFNKWKQKKDVICVIHVIQFNCDCATMVLHVRVNYFTFGMLNCVKIERENTLAT